MPRRTDLQPVPATVNGYPVIASKRATFADSECCDYIMVRREDDYVTWGYNRSCPGAFSGHYDMTLTEGAESFASRGPCDLSYIVTNAATPDERNAVREAVNARWSSL